MIQKGFELLAPAGSFQTFKAVIEAGADAIYVGGDMFGARAYADNFSNEQLLEAIDYAHLRGKQVYLTVNTLLKNNELKENLYEYLLPFYERGLDAVIVQDFGVVNFIHENFPELPIHTSTQMTVTGVEGVLFLKQYGVTRVVMAREVSLEEMKKIHEETGMELEAFVHGALCYCYSGQCLFSSMLGGRSGNRGRCAQPCRLSYSVLDDKQKEYLKDSYVLSLKDMCGIEDLDGLLDAGVYSLKIEGRMKQSEYAAGVVSYYRKYIDKCLSLSQGEAFSVDKKDMNDVMDLGNRCGFTDTYYKKHNDSSMITFVKPNYATDNEKLHNNITEKFVKDQSKLKITGRIYLHEGEEAVLEVSYKDQGVKVIGNEVSKALNKPMLAADIESRIRKTGDTPFEFDSIELDLGQGIFIPNGALNQLRRDALSELTEKLLTDYRRDTSKLELPNYDFARDPSSDNRDDNRITCSIENREQLDPVLNSSVINRVYLDWNAYDKKQLMNDFSLDVKNVVTSGKNAFLILPAICRKDTMEYMYKILPKLKELDLAGFVVKNYEAFWFVRENFKDKEIVSDHNMYTYNDIAKDSFINAGITYDTFPIELNKKEILARDNSGSEMLIYGYYPLMTTAQCVHKNTKKCDKCPGITYLKDRYKKLFPVKNNCNECYNVVFNSLPVALFNNIKEIKKSGIGSLRLSFTIESKKKTAEVIKYFETVYNNGSANNLQQIIGECTNGHYKRGVE